jgi:hypothetical protein
MERILADQNTSVVTCHSVVMCLGCCSVGNLSLTKSLKELRKITQPLQPILLTIMAEEVRTGVNEPLAMSSEVQIALIMSELDNTPPYFDSDKYVTTCPSRRAVHLASWHVHFNFTRWEDRRGIKWEGGENCITRSFVIYTLRQL